MHEATTYTYQGGRKLPLSRLTTHFISRANENQLLSDHFEPIEVISPHAWRVRTNDNTIEEDIRRARRLAPAYAAYVVSENGSQFHVTDRIFVRFHRAEDATKEAACAFGEPHGLTLLTVLSTRDVLYRVNSSLDVVDVVRWLTEEKKDVVQIADHDLNIQPQENELLIDDPLAALQWYLFSRPIDDQLVADAGVIDCQGAWQQAGFGSSDVVIGVVDCGCDLTDPNFGDEKFVSWAILVDGEVYSEEDWVRARQMMEPLRPHGTLCATLAAASANQLGGVGAAPACRLLPVKWQELTNGQVLSQSLFGGIISFLRDKVDVVSNSWNLGANAYWPPAIVDALQESVEHGGRSGKGIVWVWSAGNHNCPIDYEGESRIPTKVSSTTDGSLVVEESATRFTNSFAGLPGVVHVGAISSLGQRCHYSNYGKGLDLVAPSTNQHLYNRVEVAGMKMMVPVRAKGLQQFGGTSASAPLVAGVAALVRSANPDLSAREIVSILKQSADKKLDMTGYPRCDRPGDLPAQWDVSPIAPYESGAFAGDDDPDGTWSPWFGYGKVNARKAVELAMERKADAAAEGEQ